MNDAELVKRLPEHRCPIGHGQWLWIDENQDYWSITLANGQDTHNRAYGPAYCLEIDKKTGERWSRHNLSGCWKQAIGMWPVRSESAIRKIETKLRRAIQRAYYKHSVEKR